MIIYLNGKFVEQAEAALDPLDRGVLLGDGIFETIRCEEGQLLFHQAHFDRLSRNARLVAIPWSMTSEELLDICQQVLDANDLGDARLRVTVTRGELGGSPEIRENKTAPTVIVHAAPFNSTHFAAPRRHGWKAVIAEFPINHHSPLAQVKSISYQEHLLARLQAREKGADEALLLNSDGLLAEGSMTNLFIVRDGVVKTPPVEDGALPGILRLQLGLICSKLSIPHVKESLALQDLENADEAFLTNSLIEVIPLVRLGDKVIGSGRPGEVTRRLYEEYRHDVETFLETMRRG